MDSCPRCAAALRPEDLACPSCHALRYVSELEQLTARARELESEGRYRTSREAWLAALVHLPPNTKQAAWIVRHLEDIEGLDDAPAVGSRAPQTSRAARLGVAGPVVLLLLKGKGIVALLNAKTLITLGGFMAYYAYEFGLAFGVGFGLQILVHELGHYLDIRRRGLPADMPVFLPGLGAYVRWRALGVPDRVRAEVSLAGPFAGAIAAIVCATMYWSSGVAVWAALARAGAWLNVMNLIPVWALDGGQAASVLDRSDRLMLLSLSLVLWLLLGESVFILVAAGAAWRLFTKDLPSQSSRPIRNYFVVLLIGLGVTMWLMPGEGLGLEQ